LNLNFLSLKIKMFGTNRGDWKCDCGEGNFAKRSACRKCKLHKDQRKAVLEEKEKKEKQRKEKEVKENQEKLLREEGRKKQSDERQGELVDMYLKESEVRIATIPICFNHKIVLEKDNFCVACNAKQSFYSVQNLCTIHKSYDSWHDRCSTCCGK
jgi:hypothetical protein